MPKRQNSHVIERSRRSSAEKKQDILKLRRRIEELEKFDPKTITTRFNDPQVMALQASIADTLASVFGTGTEKYRLFSRAKSLDDGPIVSESSWVFPDGRYSEGREVQAHHYLSEGKQKSIALLNQAIKSLEEEIEFDTQNSKTLEAEINLISKPHSKRIFIVHGHDDGMREAVARFLEQNDFQPIILHEKANQSRTVIEKVEAYSDVSFAVVLLSPDDEGCKRGETPVPRVRQNVLLELGYFIGRLDRSNVCAFMRDTVEIPSDFCGVLAEKFDDNGGWRQILARELEAAGFELDWNRVMKRS
ncbi:MAG: nucleotide-binding protein [Alphaproteobacteria bacterium]